MGPFVEYALAHPSPPASGLLRPSGRSGRELINLPGGALQGASAGEADWGADLMAIIFFGTLLGCHAFCSPTGWCRC
jgi:hypothetical protein